MRICKKGQGATEYLLMLAAVLVIVAIAVYYVTTSTGAPSIVAQVKLTTGTENTVMIKGVTGCSEVASWSFSYKGGTETDWITGSGSIGPGDIIQLTGLTNDVSVGDTVTIKYDTTTKSAVISADNTWVGLT